MAGFYLSSRTTARPSSWSLFKCLDGKTNYETKCQRRSPTTENLWFSAYILTTQLSVTYAVRLRLVFALDCGCRLEPLPMSETFYSKRSPVALCLITSVYSYLRAIDTSILFLCQVLSWVLTSLAPRLHMDLNEFQLLFSKNKIQCPLVKSSEDP